MAQENARTTDNLGSNELANDRKLELLSDAPSGKEYCGSPVRNLGRGTGGGCSISCESGFQFGKSRSGGAVTDAVISVDNNFLLLLGFGVNPLDLDGGDFVLP